MFAENVSQFFDSDEFAHRARWVPRNGESAVEADVLFETTDTPATLGFDAITRQHSMVYPADVLVGLAKGEGVTIGNVDEDGAFINGVDYLVREDPRAIEDGSMMAAALGRYQS